MAEIPSQEREALTQNVRTLVPQVYNPGKHLSIPECTPPILAGVHTLITKTKTNQASPSQDCAEWWAVSSAVQCDGTDRSLGPNRKQPCRSGPWLHGADGPVDGKTCKCRLACIACLAL